MLHLTASGRLDTLADELAATLGEPLDDPMTQEWVVVASAGMQRWLRLRLARRLGVGSPGGGDGVAANLDLLFPGTLRSRLLTPDSGDEPDPWHLDRLPWAVLDVLADAGDDAVLAGLAEPPRGGSSWGRARRLADLFDRYSVHRPEMLRRWASGEDVDGTGAPLGATAGWQPHLWRLVRDRIGSPSPAELLPERIAALRDGCLPIEAPERIALFGLSTIPGGHPFLELLEALSACREVHLLLFRPSPAVAASVRGAGTDSSGRALLRSEDRSAEAVTHPLLRSWARPSREAEVLLAGAEIRSVDPAPAGRSEAHGPLLARIQADLRSGTEPTGGFVPEEGDRSIRIHSCHGTTRQVEVLRDELLHLLADDPALTEDEIVVLCPAVEQYAPFIEAVFGPSAERPRDRREPRGTGHDRVAGIRYRIADRSLSDSSPLFGALGTLVDLLGSRFSAPALLDFVALPAVRARFGFDDAAVTRIAEWVEDADVSWGLDGSHREAWHVPSEYEGGTWCLALDRLLTGICVSDDPELPLALGELLPLGVEGEEIDLAGRVADLLARLAALTDETSRPHPAAEWSELLGRAAGELFDVDPRMRWQQHRLTEVLVSICENARVGGAPVSVELTLADVRRLLVHALPATGIRPEFFRGGVTISSLTPLRGIPHRVVCLLGMDEGAFGMRGPDGDDLTAAAPFVGDRDHRADVRQALLESVLAARDVLVILRTGHSVVTNRPVPASVPLAELRDAMSMTLDASVRREVLGRIELVHPRQAFDERNFGVGGRAPEDLFAYDGPWSFDPVARDGAAARLDGRRDAALLLDVPLDTDTPDLIDLADLRAFLEHPISHFLRTVLQITLPKAPSRAGGASVRIAGDGPRGVEPPTLTGPDIPLALDALELWKLKDRLLVHLLAGGDVDAFTRREKAGGGLPPGRLAGLALAKVISAVEPLIEGVRELGVVSASGSQVLVDVSLPSGGRVVGSVRDDRGHQPGPVRVYPSQSTGKRRLVSWLDLIVLTASDPEADWWSVLVCTADRKDPVSTEKMVIPGEDAAERHRRAIDALGVVVDCYRRGRREPLPLFPRLSPALHEERSLAQAWESRYRGGDGEDRWIRLAFGGAGLDEVCNLPLRGDDPDGPGEDRARRHASYLWGAVGTSLAAPEAPDGGGEGRG